MGAISLAQMLSLSQHFNHLFQSFFIRSVISLFITSCFCMSSKPLPLLPHERVATQRVKLLSNNPFRKAMDDDAASEFSSSTPSHETRAAAPNSNHGGRELVVQDQDTQYHKEHILQELSEKQFPPEDSELIVKAFEKTFVGHSRVTYYDGIRVQEVADGVVEPRVGITFMAGADTPQVNMNEQIDMTQNIPDQKDALWRVNTAGALLRNFEVDKDMSITQTDNTPTVVASARHRRVFEDGPFFERTAPSKAIARRGRDRSDRTVTIDSDNVKIVNNLNEGNWDLEATLIEVDQSSLVALMINYKTLIRQDGSALTFTRTVRSRSMPSEIKLTVAKPDGIARHND